MSSATTDQLPTLRGASDEDIRHLADIVFDTVGRPLGSAALFYALYWLVEIEGIQEAAFDLKQQRERQARGFWWYGTFSMASEFSHACSRYYIVGENIADKDFFQSREHAEEFLFPDDPEMAKAATHFLLRACDLNAFTNQRNLAGYENTFGFLRARLEDDLSPGLGPWVEIARDLFQAMPSRDMSPDLVRANDETGWPIGFNGPAWVAIGNHLLRRGELSETAWVDQCWALEHNNRNWIDKIDITIGGQTEAATRAVLPATRDIDLDHSNVLGALIEVLDANQEGDMEMVFKAAIEFDRAVDVNLRRLARQLGVHP